MEKMYVLVRSDLSKSQQAVQGGHAVAEYLLMCDRDNITWNNGTIVYLDIPYEKELRLWCKKLNDIELEYYEFYEIDINNQMTALATVTDDEELFNDVLLL
jgi:hypothetical protein